MLIEPGHRGEKNARALKRQQSGFEPRLHCRQKGQSTA